jgi:hypothetical protein
MTKEELRALAKEQADRAIELEHEDMDMMNAVLEERARKRREARDSASPGAAAPENGAEPVVYYLVDFRDGRAPVKKDTLQSAKEYGDERAALDHTHKDVMIVDDIGDPVSVRYWHRWNDCIDYPPDYDPEKDGNKSPIEFEDGWYDDWLDLDE